MKAQGCRYIDWCEMTDRDSNSNHIVLVMILKPKPKFIKVQLFNNISINKSDEQFIQRVL